jgi:hypothetical protein
VGGAAALQIGAATRQRRVDQLLGLGQGLDALGELGALASAVGGPVRAVVEQRDDLGQREAGRLQALDHLQAVEGLHAVAPGAAVVLVGGDQPAALVVAQRGRGEAGATRQLADRDGVAHVVGPQRPPR